MPLRQTTTAPPGSAARLTFIGASEIGAVLGVSPYAGAWSVWAQKLELTPPVETTLPMLIGHALEPLIRHLASEHLGADVVGNLPTYLYRAHLGANLDGAVLRSDGTVARVVECKAWGERDADGVHMMALGAEQLGNEPSKFAAAWWQIQQQMLCADAPVATLAALCGKSPIFVEIEADRAAQRVIEGEGLGFWRAHIATRIAPDASPADIGALRSRDARPELGAVDLSDDADLADALAQRAYLAAQAKEIEAQLDASEATIRGALGDAPRATCGNYTITRAASQRVTLDAAALRAAFGPAIQKFEKSSVTERMTVRSGNKTFIRGERNED